MKNKADTFILGADKRCFLSTDSYETKLNNNIMVVGGSGSGKTRGIVLPTCLNMKNGNAVIILSKEGEFSKVKAYMKTQGYNVYTINFKNPGEMGYDPLKYCDSLNDVRDLAHSIVWAGTSEDKKPTDIYWLDSAENLLYLTLVYVWKGYYLEGNTLSSALQLLDSLVWLKAKETSEVCEQNIELSSLIKKFISECQDVDLALKLANIKNEIEWHINKREEVVKEKSLIYYEFEKNLKEKLPELYYIWDSFKTLPDTTGACVVGSLQTPLGKMFMEDIRNILKNKKQFQLEKLLEPKTVLFLHVSPVSMAQHNFVGIFYTQLFKKLFELAEKEADSKLPYHVEVIGDDFATGCKIPHFQDLISIFREKNIGAMMLIQSETQLASMYGKNNATTIINNCDSYVYLGGMDIATCESISKRMNLPYTDIQNMKVGKEIFIRRGMSPFETKSYDIEADILYQREIKNRHEFQERREKDDLSYNGHSLGT